MTHVIVIGAGVVGSSVAFRLSQAGADVTVIDRDTPGSGTTGNSFAWVNANQKTPRNYFELNVEGMREHDRLERELGAAPWLHHTGNLVWTGDPVRYDELCQRVERLQSWGYNASWINAADVNRDLEPDLQFSGPKMRVAWFPDESWLDGPGYVHGLLDRAIENGARMRTGQDVVDMSTAGEGVSVSLSDSQTLVADAVVNAAGPAADRVAQLVGRTLPLAPTRGLLVRVDPDRPLLSRMVHSTEVNLRPDGGTSILLHHSSIDPLIGDRSEVPLDDEHPRELCKRARRVLPGIHASQIVETRVGVRPYPRDGISCLGAVSSIPGYFEAVTHSGVTLGPLAGRLLTEEILNGRVDSILEPFRPDRF